MKKKKNRTFVINLEDMRKNAAMLLDGIIQLTMINTKNKMFVQS